MKDLIQQAAEASSDPGVYASVVINFLSYAKENGEELLRVEGDVEEIIENLDTHTIEFYNDEDAAECYDEMCNSDEASDAIRKAYALGSAKERERMKGVFEKAGIEGWRFRDGMWENYISPMFTMFKTTDEIINLYKNKEG